MSAKLGIRKDRTPASLRKLARAETDGRVARRLLAIANALAGMTRKEAAEAAGMDRQTLRDWVLRYNEHGIEGLSDRWGDGRPARLTAQEQSELVSIILSGPDPEASGISAFTLDDIVRIAAERFGKPFHPASMSRVVRRMGLSRQKARPLHPETDPAAQAAFKKSPGTAQAHSVYAQK